MWDQSTSRTRTTVFDRTRWSSSRGHDTPERAVNKSLRLKSQRPSGGRRSCMFLSGPVHPWVARLTSTTSIVVSSNIHVGASRSVTGGFSWGHRVALLRRVTEVVQEVAKSVVNSLLILIFFPKTNYYFRNRRIHIFPFYKL